MPQTSSNRVRDPADPATTTDDPPVVDTQDDVDAVAAKPGSLVEPVLGAARRSHDHERLQDGSLRRCASARKFQQDRLAQRQPAEALDDGWRPNVELAGMHRARDDQPCTLRCVDSRAQRTASRARRDGCFPSTNRAARGRPRGAATAAARRHQGRPTRADRRGGARRHRSPAPRSRPRGPDRAKPRAAAGSAGRRRARSRRDQVPKRLEPRRPDARDRIELVD